MLLKFKINHERPFNCNFKTFNVLHYPENVTINFLSSNPICATNIWICYWIVTFFGIEKVHKHKKNPLQNIKSPLICILFVVLETVHRISSPFFLSYIVFYIEVLISFLIYVLRYLTIKFVSLEYKVKVFLSKIYQI